MMKTDLEIAQHDLAGPHFDAGDGSIAVYLARVRGYSALQIGETMFVTGICMFVMAPISGQLMRRGVDPRLMLAVGFTGFAVGAYQASLLTSEWNFNELLVPQMLRGISLMLIMIPVTTTALETTPQWKLKNASGLFNLRPRRGLAKWCASGDRQGHRRR